MTKKVRVLFVLFSALFLILLQALIIGFTYYRSSRHLADNADKTLTQILSGETGEDTANHYFTVTLDESRNVAHTKLMNIGPAVKENIARFMKTALETSDDSGFVDEYRFLKKETPEGMKIAFLSRSGNLTMLKSNIRSMVLFSGIGILVAVIALIFVSKLIVWPIEEGERRQKEFITSASHGLKTPLTIISTATDLLENDVPDNEWVGTIREQAAKLCDMTGNLVQLSKMEELGRKKNFIEFPLSDVVTELVRAFEPVAESKTQTVSRDIAPDLSYFGDENEIRQLVTLLLDNAHKYGGENGEVSVALEKKKNGAEFRVTNTSPYYEKEQLGKLFDRFYRGAEVNEKGFGIGLYMAKKIVERHNGKIEAYMEGESRFAIRVFLRESR